MQPRESVEKMALPIFGLASYKLRGSVWTSIKGSAHQLVNSLFQAADNWLRLHQVNHPDFIFFCRQGSQILYYDEEKKDVESYKKELFIITVLKKPYI